MLLMLPSLKMNELRLTQLKDLPEGYHLYIDIMRITLEIITN